MLFGYKYEMYIPGYIQPLGNDLYLYFFHSDIDECMKNECSPNAHCNNTIGSFACTCNEGYFGDGRNCTSK